MKQTQKLTRILKRSSPVQQNLKKKQIPPKNVKKILIINVQTKYMERSVFKEILPTPNFFLHKIYQKYNEKWNNINLP